MALVRIEPEQRPDARVLACSPPASTSHAALDDDDPGVLLHLVVAQLLARLEAEQDRARLVAGVQRRPGRACPAGRRRPSVPALARAGEILTRPGVRLEPPVPLAVEQLPLGPIGTNCYRRAAPTATAPRRSSSTRAATRRSSAWRSPRSGATLRGDPVTHSHWDHLVGVAELAEGTGAPVYMPAGRAARLLERPERLLRRPAASRSARYERESARSRAARRSRPPGSRSRSRRARPLARPRRVLRRRLPLLRRRPLRGLGRPRPTSRSATGTRCSPRSAARRALIRPRRSSTRATARRRRSAPSSPATRSSPSSAPHGEVRGAARDARHPARRAAARGAR